VKLDGAQRGGLLTQGAILTGSCLSTSHPRRRSGQVGTGESAGPTAAAAAAVPVFDSSQLARDCLEARAPGSSTPQESELFPFPLPQHDGPMGLGLETYDAVGVWPL